MTWTPTSILSGPEVSLAGYAPPVENWTTSERVAFGKRLAEAREMAGKKQPDIAAMLGYDSKQAVSSWEKGRNMPPADVVAQLSMEYGVSCEWLLFGVREVNFTLKLRDRLSKCSGDELRLVENMARLQLGMEILTPPSEKPNAA